MPREPMVCRFNNPKPSEWFNNYKDRHKIACPDEFEKWVEQSIKAEGNPERFVHKRFYDSGSRTATYGAVNQTEAAIVCIGITITQVSEQQSRDVEDELDKTEGPGSGYLDKYQFVLAANRILKDDPLFDPLA